MSVRAKLAAYADAIARGEDPDEPHLVQLRREVRRRAARVGQAAEAELVLLALHGRRDGLEPPGPIPLDSLGRRVTAARH